MTDHNPNEVPEADDLEQQQPVRSEPGTPPSDDEDADADRVEVPEPDRFEQRQPVESDETPVDDDFRPALDPERPVSDQ